MSNRRSGYAAGGALAVLLLTGCAAATTAAGAGGAADASPPSGGSAGPAATAHPQPPASTAPPPITGCVTGQQRITIGPGQLPEPRCLRVGATLIIEAPSARLQPWQPFTTSDARVLSCTTSQAADGAATATCHASRPGHATLTTMTGPFSGDPHGPPQRQWQLTVLVRA